MSQAIERKYHRRKLGKLISDPIDQLQESKTKNGLIFIEKNEEVAALTRAAAVMYIGRNNYDLHSSVKSNEVWIMKDKDELGGYFEIDLR